MERSTYNESVDRFLSHQRVLWLGDSITQNGAYVSYIEYLLTLLFPDAELDFISLGVNGETVSGLSESGLLPSRPWLAERLPTALRDVKPQTVVACYGMNDGIFHPQSADRMAAFRRGILHLSVSVHEAKAKLILITPPPFDPVPIRSVVRKGDAGEFSYKAPFEAYDDVLTDYGAWEVSLFPDDAEFVVDVHSMLASYIARVRTCQPDFCLAADGIHPSLFGHFLMAQAFVRAFGIAVGGDDPTQDNDGLTIDPLTRKVRRSSAINRAEKTPPFE